MSWLSNLIYGKDPGPSQTNGAFDSALRRQGQSADQYGGEYQSKEQAFDPAAGFSAYTQGALGSLKETLGQSLKQLTGKAVGAGRLDTGFFDEDQGQVVRNVSQDFTNNVNQHAVDVLGLQQHNIDSLGNVMEQEKGNYYDMLSGQLDRETAQNNAKRQQRGDFVNGLLKVGGMVAAGI